jgi:transmembrane sensor
MGLRYVIKTSKRASPQDVSGIQYSHDIQPARNHALLTTPGGKVIDLDSNAANTVVLLQAGARLVKNGSGEWVYRSGGKATAGDGSAAGGDGNGSDGHAVGGADRGVGGGDDNATVYNTISAPRGGQFSFVLEDGTRVWLNASSSMRFPVAFRGKSREVTVEGEAYLEVAKNMNMPFLVQARGMQVKVLGTRFNVNAYTDESEIRTTLLDGAVQIIKDKTEVMLQPGEQASCKPDGTVNTVKDPDVVDAAMAWRSGYFSFDEDNIQTVMRQISRWYDVDIRYEGPVTKAVFGGDLGRDLTLVQVLRVLQKSQVHFRLEGNVLTILP